MGYTASAVLAAAVGTRLDVLSDIVGELISLDTDSSRYFACILATNVALGHSEFAERVLDLFYRQLIPAVLEQPQVHADSLVSWLAIAEQSPVSTKVFSRRIVDLIVNSTGSRSDPQLVDKVATAFAHCWFYPSPALGESLTEYLIERNTLSDQKWRFATLRVMAGMLARSPAALERFIERHTLPPEIVNEIRDALTPQLLRLRGEVSYQTSWNVFLVHGLNHVTKLRYFLIKILFGGIVQSNSVEEYSREFRRLVLETARAYLYSEAEPRHYDTLTVEEALRETESKRVIAGGKAWVPRTAINPA
jgi:hypothetical protein